MSEPSYALKAADLAWNNGRPSSVDYGDIYWSGESARAEKAYVFRDRHNLTQRANRADYLTLVETGFGFANNFLLTAELWATLRPRARLNYVAIENRPVDPATLRTYLQNWDTAHADWLTNIYPAPLRTTFTCHGPHNVSLTLIFDDVDRALRDLDGGIDAWYLDGFSPAKNTAMWDESLWRRVWDLSHQGATISTYTVAGAVRRGLSAEGFLLEKIPGFGTKGEMLVAKKPGSWQPTHKQSDDALIVGAGIAGQSVKQSLLRRGIRARTIGDSPGASHLPSLNVYPQLTAGPQERARFSLAANYFTQHHDLSFQRQAVIYRTADAEKQVRARRIAEQFPDSYLSQIDEGAICYHEAGWLSCPYQPDISGTLGSLVRVDDQWQLRDPSGVLLGASPVVVLAGGHRMQPFLPVPGIAIRGQSVAVDLNPVPGYIQTGDISVALLPNGHSLLGSTYGVGSDDTNVSEADTAELLQAAKTSGTIMGDVNILAVYTGVRRATRDRLPLAGPVPDWTQLESHVAKFAKYPFRVYQPGLFALNALGSRGATHGPICADHVAALIAGDKPVLPLKQQRMLELQRFHLRDGRRA